MLASERNLEIAVVGLACRLPSAPDPEAFWHLLHDARDAIGDAPDDRLPAEGRSELAASMPGLLRGGFIDGIDQFDADFFGIAPNEATLMDPQQRLLLELSREALEDGGMVPEALASSETGVFVGAISGDYGELVKARGAQFLTRHALTGTNRGIIANRVSYVLGLRGPSMTVDTAQSSALVAVHLACESLRSGESTLALAGGVNLNIGLDGAVSAHALGALSPDGRCFTFDARANGYVRGEGGGIVALKLLGRAVADGDHVYGVIRSTAVNNDGGGEGLTAPARRAQEHVLELACRRAGVALSDVQYVELHGTGTKLGDQVEAAALGATLGSSRDPAAPLVVGSAKTNVGHLEGASGIVGLIKTILCVAHRELPASLNFREPGPDLPLGDLGLRVQQSSGPWPAPDRPLLAGVSSFGMGGTNCHVVVAEPPAPAEATGDRPAAGIVPWVVSAKSEAGLRDQAGRLLAHVRVRPELDAADVGQALVTTRSLFEHRAVVLGHDADRLEAGLEALSRGEVAANVVSGVGVVGGGVAFVFPGQGAQWVGMAVGLLEESVVFAGVIAECEEAFSGFVGWSLVDVLRGVGGAPGLERVDVVQPVLFAVMVGLAEVWRSFGVVPSVVVGHSQGEVAAAYVAGGLSLGDAARVVCLRSRVVAEGLAGRGGMVSVALSLSGCEELVGRFGGRVSVAAVNGPGSVVLSGEEGALGEVLAGCERDGVWARRIAVDYPSHSEVVGELEERLLADLAGIEPRSGSVAFFSTVEARLVDTAELDAGYWYRNLRERVRFGEVVQALVADGVGAFVEVSPNPGLTGAIQDTVDEMLDEDAREVAVVGTLRRDQGGLDRFHTSLARWFVHGGAVEWESVFGGAPAGRVPLPTSAFQRRRFWLEDAPTAAPVGASTPAAAPAPPTDADRAPEHGPIGALAQRLDGRSAAASRRAILELVRTHVAVVLGHDSAAAIDAGRSFKDLGFDSPSAVDLRNALAAATGLRLPSSLLFDHPTPSAVADRLLVEVSGPGTGPSAASETRTASAEDPIAIVGMSCRYPGDVASPDDLWRLVASGREAIGDFPGDRGWDLERLFDPDPEHQGTSYTRRGGFLYGAGDFDADLFSISPREALAMDPQQRLLLEGAWEAFEDAGIAPTSLRGSRTGVFVGIMASDYGPRLHAATDGSEGFGLTGSLSSVASGRLSYVFGLEGPSMSVDTACSASLVALHLACQALRQGECELALAGGATVMANPGIFVEFSRQRGLSRDGRCKAFGAGADGTGWSEGSGLVLLQRLSDARRAGRQVLGIVRGSAINQDGASNGLTAPNGPSQERVIREALASAGVSAADVDAVEAHGTGTTLGDPIEAQALLATYGRERSGAPVYLGSLKSNIGHTQAAAGIGGVIKMVQAMRHGVLPPTLHCEERSPHVDWSAGELELLQAPLEWTTGERPRRAAVSSFGISGTNAHVILEEAREPAPAAPAGPPPAPVVPVLVSAASSPALKAQAGRLASFLERDPERRLDEVARGLAAQRTHLRHRAAVVTGERADVISALRAVERGEPGNALVGERAGGETVAFLFSGQGSQWPGMGAELHREFPVFAEALDEVCRVLDTHLERPLLEVMFAVPGSDEAELLTDTRYTQVALFALEIALFRLVGSFGVTADFLIGHSLGEFAAAYVAGVFSLEDGCRLVAERARLMSALPKGGAMLAVEATEAEVADSLDGFEARVSIAAVNGPTATVISGEQDAISELDGAWRERGRRTARLQVSHAFHSALMEPMLDELKVVAESITFAEPQIPIASNVTGELLTADQAASPEYWARHVRESVRFADGVRLLLDAGVTRFLELGPDGTLTAMAAQGAGLESDALFASTQRGSKLPQREALLGGLASAHCAGIDIDWSALLGANGLGHVELPRYAFQHQRFWLEPAADAGDLAAAGQASADHPLLGAAVRLAGDQEDWLFTGRLSLKSHPWLADHAVTDVVLLPGVGFVELALAVAERIDAGELDELLLVAPLAFDEVRAVQVQVVVAVPDDDGRRAINIYCSPEGDDRWTLHASGLLGSADEAPAGDEALQAFAAASWPPDGAEPIDVAGFYDRVADAGYDYGPAFQGLRAAYRGDEAFYAEIALDGDQATQADAFCLHPALADAALQTMLLGALEREDPEAAPEVPFSFSGLRVHQAGASLLRVRMEILDGAEPGATTIRLQALDGAGAPALEIETLKVRAIDRDALKARASSAGRDALFTVDWPDIKGGTPDGPTLQVALVGDEDPGDLDPPGLEIARYPNLGALEEMIAAGVAMPAVVLLRAPAPAPATPPAEAAQELAERVLEVLQAWLASEELTEARLVLLTDGAVAITDGESPNLAQAALPGLMRSAQAENPGRLGLIDLDGSEASADRLHDAIASDEPELALRVGALHAPRLARATVAEGASTAAPERDGTILITGGTGGLGALVARHFAAEHGARRLLLASRRGPAAKGVEELVTALGELGCEARVEACDVADRAQVEALLAGIAPEHPLTVVVHAAGVLDDGVIVSLDAERLRRVMAPKVAGAFHLHELTKDAELSQFLLFSSVASALGTPGQGNYAAANAFLDGLAHHRRAAGLPATALAWGTWERAGGMAGDLDAADLERFARAGITALSDEQGLALLDAARGDARALLVPVGLDGAALRAQAKARTLPAIFSELFRTATRTAAGAQGSLATRLESVPESDWPAVILDLVQTHVAGVLGHASGGAVDPQRAFKELGFDSLGAIELRNRLSQATGLKLPTTLVFDHASPAAVAEFLRSKVGGGERGGPVARNSRTQRDEPIAIVGMSARYPGGVRSAEELWQLVLAGEDAISEFPDDRGWDLERLYDPDPDGAGTSYTRHGGFVHDAGDFDAEFFSIAPREAVAIDPQQRLLLEGAWEALEDAGIDPFRLKGTQTGVFAGVMYHDYGIGGTVPPELEGFIGTAASLVSGRVAYALGLEGPAVSIDTACSSSLVSLHLACQALRDGECELAIAGGATVLATPSAFIQFSRQRALSADGRCKPFGADADGVGWAEGCGLVVLERLSDAQRAGHRVRALVRGTAVNQDGASNGLTAPNGPSQERVIRQALAGAGLTPGDVDAVEGHGTGTSLGDPIEAQALLATYGQERPHGPLYLGSVKSNIGHTQAAAGIAGVIKMVQALRHGILPRSLRCDEPSPHVDWSVGEIELLSSPVSWRGGDRVRRAGISSFGISGTNAHVIVEEAPDAEEALGAVPEAPLPVIPLLVSARSDAALAAQAGRLREWLLDCGELEAIDVASSLATARAQMERRAVVTGADREELLAGLAALAAEEPAAGVVTGEVRAGKTAFLFTGQGAQWPGMGGALSAAFPVFADALDEVCTELDRHLDRPLKEVLLSDDPALLGRTEFTQTGLFALEVALFRLFASWGVRPELMIGHSVGELVAAHVSGVFSLEDACTLVAARGRLMGALPEGGAMLAVEASEDELDLGDGLSLAGVNGPRAVVLSGALTAIEAAETLWRDRGRKTSRLKVSHAFHSLLMEPMLEEFRAVAGGLSFGQPRVPIVSNVSGTLVAEEMSDPEYWVRHVREAVRFADGVAELERLGVTRFVEIGPDGVLSAMARLSVGEELADRALFVPAMRAGREQVATLVGCLGAMHSAGTTVDWTAFFADQGARLVDLPTYAFQRERYWLDSVGARGGGDLGAAGASAIDHPLLSAASPVAGGHGTSFSGRVSLARQPWLRDHAVLDRVLFPATAFVELALAAGAELGCSHVEELTLEAPLILNDDDEVTFQLLVGEDDGAGQRPVEVFSRGSAALEASGDAHRWARHAGGVLGSAEHPVGEPSRRLTAEAWPPAGAEAIEVDAMYDRLADIGFGYGPAFQGAVAAWRRGTETFCELALTAELAEGAEQYVVHPALLDAAFHAALDGLAQGSGVPLPFALSGVRVARPGTASIRVGLTTATDGSGLSLAAVDADGAVVLELDALALRTVDAAQLGAAERSAGDSAFVHEWVELLPEDAGARPGPRPVVLGAGLPGESPDHSGIDGLIAAIERGAEVPPVVLASMPDLPDDVAAAARAGVVSLLSLLQAWLATEALAESRLILVTRGAVVVDDGEPGDPARAAAWGLMRSAQSEHPGRFGLVDVGSGDPATIDWAALSTGAEPQLAVRRGRVYALRLARLHTTTALAVPESTAWHLDAPNGGTLEDLTLAEGSRAERPLEPHEVRIAVRAGGLNFRDVLIALDQYPDADPIGSEGAGVVLEVGDAVTDLAVGERVLGLIPEAFGPRAVADGRMVAGTPEGWTHAEAASVPITFMTAYFGLVDVGALAAGQRVLVHAGAGGVGLAAIQLAQHLGAEVYATASPAKWGLLRGLGLDADHIASSRDLGFRERFLAATGGDGVDVVLNALAAEFVDASLTLLPRGGRFVELGKADVRDPDRIAREHPGVEYRAIDLVRAAGPERVGEILAAVLGLFDAGALRLPPIRAWDVRHAAEAFRHLGDGRSAGKVVLTIPRPIDADGTVLITGGTGDLGARVARHLAAEHGVCRLLLASRRGPKAPGAAELAEGLRALGAEPEIVACDVTSREALAALLDSVGRDHPLTAVVHTAGVLDDGVVETLTSAQVESVMRPKVDAAVLLDELTRGMDLAEFVLFSSDSGTVGVPGQGNYAAANVFLDALAERRRADGLPAKSLAWGLWSNATGIAGGLDDADLARLSRLGVAAMENELELFDLARASAETVVVPSRLDMAALRAAAEAGALAPLMRELVRARPQRAREDGGSLEQRLGAVPEHEREDVVLTFVSEHVAAVLGHATIDPVRKFKELGADSLAAIELRNRLGQASGLRLPSTLIFDHPSPAALSRYLLRKLAPPTPNGGGAPQPGEADVRRVLLAIPIERLREAGLLDPLVRLAADDNGAATMPSDSVAELGIDDLLRLAKS